MERVDPAIFTVRSPAAIAGALGDAGFSEAAVHSAPDGATHLITAVRPGS
jgi:hypothetical protein